MENSCRPAICLSSSGNVAAARTTPKITVSEKSLLLPGEALPTDITSLVRGADEGVVMVHFAVAFLATNLCLASSFWIDLFCHN